MIEGEGTAFGRLLQRGDGLGFDAAPAEGLQASPDGADVLLFELR